MRKRFAIAIMRWFLLIWVGSLLFAVVLVGPAILLVRSIATDVREALARNDYSAAASSATKLQLPANTCRIALLLPAPYTLQWIPGVSRWVEAANLVCHIGYNVGAAAQLPGVRRVTLAMDGKPLSTLHADQALLRDTVAAAIDAEPLVHEALTLVQRLNTLQLPGDLGRRVFNVSRAWPPHRVAEMHTLLGVSNSLLGFDKPRTYFVALQSEAEMRAMGGFLGQYAIVRIAAGKPEVLHVGINSELRTPPSADVELLPNTEVLTLTDNPMPANSNLSPQGPDVAAIWLNTWTKQTGERLDGAIAIDVETAARLVEAAGRSIAKPDGTALLRADDISAYAQNGVYFDFSSADEAGAPRKEYQLTVFRDLLTNAATSAFTFDSMLRVLPTAFAEGRVMLSFADSALQDQIKTSPVAKDLRQQPNLMYVTWNNWSGNKFDYYIEPKATARCVANGLELQVSVTASADPKGQYPPYIKQRLELPSETRPSVRDQFLLVMPRGSNVRWLTVDGRVARYDIVPFAGRPVAQLLLDTVAGETHTVRAGLGGIDRASIQVIGSAPHTIRC